MGSLDQIDHCLQYFAAYPDAFAVVDPVMGDNGKAYRTYTPDMCRRMNELVAVADMITPNLTEASILLGIPYPNAPMRDVYKRQLLTRCGTEQPP